MANDTERRVLRVLEHIHANPAADLSLDALADVAAMSRFHWHRLFRAVTGETAAQTVRRMRMHRAAVAHAVHRKREQALSEGRPIDLPVIPKSPPVCSAPVPYTLPVNPNQPLTAQPCP